MRSTQSSDSDKIFILITVFLGGNFFLGILNLLFFIYFFNFFYSLIVSGPRHEGELVSYINGVPADLIVQFFMMFANALFISILIAFSLPTSHKDKIIYSVLFFFVEFVVAYFLIQIVGIFGAMGG